MITLGPIIDDTGLYQQKGKDIGASDTRKTTYNATTEPTSLRISLPTKRNTAIPTTHNATTKPRRLRIGLPSTRTTAIPCNHHQRENGPNSRS